MAPDSEARVPAGSSRLRRRLLRGAIDDNLRAIQNVPRGDLHRRPPIPWTIVGAVAALGVAGLALWLSTSSPAAAPLPSAVGARPAEPMLVAARPASEPPARISSQVFPVAVRRVVLDPGHGGSDLGTRTTSGLTEKELTLDIADRLGRRLRSAGFETVMTREGDARLLLRERSRLANDRAADLFLSIHVNWFEDGRANRGIETYYLGPSDDPYVTELASTENRESGYAIADVRRLLDSIYADLRQEQSRALAERVQERLVSSIREVSPEVADRGVKSAPFLVLVTTEMPAILAEVACLSNAEEAKLLGQPDYRERIAGALFDGIRAYSDSVATPATRTEAR